MTKTEFIGYQRLKGKSAADYSIPLDVGDRLYTLHCSIVTKNGRNSLVGYLAEKKREAVKGDEAGVESIRS